MRNVMEKAQALAQAIVDSSVYQRMQQAEAQVTQDEGAARVIADFMEKRKAVEDMLSREDMDPAALAKVSEAMEQSEKALGEQALVKELQQARADFDQMMENVNRILRLVITGEPDGGSCGGDCAGCSGSCASCSGCGE